MSRLENILHGRYAGNFQFQSREGLDWGTARMSAKSHKSRAVEAAFPICKELNCPIEAWGNDSLVAEIKNPVHLKSLKLRLAELGFHFHPNEDSQAAQLYDFSLSTEAAKSTKPNQYQGQKVIRLPPVARFQTMGVFLLCASVVILAHHPLRSKDRFYWQFSLALSPFLLFYALRNILWKIEFLIGGFNIHSLFSKQFIAWSDIASFEVDPSKRYGGVVFKLRSKTTVKSPGMDRFHAGDMRDEMKRRLEEERAHGG